MRRITIALVAAFLLGASALPANADHTVKHKCQDDTDGTGLEFVCENVPDQGLPF